MLEWMTVAQAAAYLKVNRNTIYRWCESGRLRYYELETGGGRRFRLEDLDALLVPSGLYWLVEVRLQAIPNAVTAQPPGSLGPNVFTDEDVERLRAALHRRPGPFGSPPPPEPWLVSAGLAGPDIEARFSADHDVSDEELAGPIADALMPRVPGRLVRIKTRGPLGSVARTGEPPPAQT
jgi:excisionase family DNA binding protein